MTNLTIANVETLSHDDSYSYSFSSDGHQFGGGHGPLAPSGSAIAVESAPIVYSDTFESLALKNQTVR